MRLPLLAVLTQLAAPPPVHAESATEAIDDSRSSEEKPPFELDDVLQRLDDLYRTDASISRVELKIVRPRNERLLSMKIETKGTDRALVVIEQPSRERGTATLRVDQNLWNYFPRISRTIRIPPSMRLQPWMGSDITNDDIVKCSSYRDDFDAELIGRSRTPRGWLIRLRAKKGRADLWKRIDMVVDRKGELPLRATYYDRRNRPARVMVFEDVTEFGKRRVPAHLVLEPLDREGYVTEMTYVDIKFNARVPESTFSLSSLERR
jgi:outer membrane lipoprotein-sorting protein